MYADLKENFYCAMSSSIWMRWNFIKCSISHLIAWILIIITAISIIIPSLSLQKQIGSTQLGPGHANKCWVQQQGWHFSLAFWMCKYCTKCCVTTCGYFLAEKRLLWFQIEHFQLYWWACSNSRQIWGLFVQIHDAENPCCAVIVTAWDTISFLGCVSHLRVLEAAGHSIAERLKSLERKMCNSCNLGQKFQHEHLFKYSLDLVVG